MTCLKFSASIVPDLGFRTGGRRSTDSVRPAFSPFPFYIFTFFIISFYLFIYFWLSQIQDPVTQWPSFPTPVHPTFEKQSLLQCSGAAFKTHYTALEWKQNICRDYQTFLHCKQHKKTRECTSSPCKPAFPVFVASFLLHLLASVGQFTCRNATLKSEALLQVIFKKILVFKVPC